MSLTPLIVWMKGPLTKTVESAFLSIIENEVLSSIFKIPVLETYAHDADFCQTYKTNIKNPCAFKNILANLKNGHYSEIGQISYHFLLITYNSIRFNIKPGYTLEQALRPKNCTPIIEATGRLYNEIIRVFQANVFEGKIISTKARHFNDIFLEVERHFACPVDMKQHIARKLVPKSDSDALDLLFAPHPSGSLDTQSNNNNKTLRSLKSNSRLSTPACPNSTGSFNKEADPTSCPLNSADDAGSGRSVSKKVTFDLPSTLNELRPTPGALTPMNSSTLTTSALKETQPVQKRARSASSQQQSSTITATPSISQAQHSLSDTGLSNTFRSKVYDISKDPIRERNMRLFNCAAYLMSYSNERRAKVFAQIRAVLNIDETVRDIDLNVLCRTELQLREVLDIIEQG
ncbi:Hypothetical protein GLP15_2990 [Giardia lamblia P15]|uniref:Bromo domain-containing protein n=1 Tax=Giardia intestinalis (strain P15) TaxID=658858 RepID=E1EYX8_GIAIA|nr:Hypothetical protein GLP15_2990 [Giardia lamblia P15]